MPWIFFNTSAAYAIDQFEIQVYDAEINPVGVYTLENHLNYVISGLGQPTYGGQIPYNHLLHATQEFARGMTEYWEVGFYYQQAITFPATYHYAGVKLRNKFVVPRRISGDFQFGVNFEISTIPDIFEDSQYALEVRPILGYTLEPFTLTFNPILGWSLSGSAASSVPEFSPALKLLWDTKHHFGLGFEYYSGIGPLNNVPELKYEEQYFYGAFDLLDQGWELNLGLGTGLTSESNEITAKAIIGFRL